MRCPLSDDPRQVDIALIGVPYDGGVTNRPGARHGPREIRNSSTLMRTIHHVTRFNPFEACRVADLGDVRFSSMFDPVIVAEEIESFFREIIDAGAIPLSVGGDHSISYPILKALGRVEPVGLKTEPEPLDLTERPPEGGSTDVADVSWVVPTLHLSVTTAAHEAPWHAWPVVATGGMSIGHKGMVYAAKALAATMVDLYEDPEQRKAIAKEFEEETKGFKMKLYIPKGPPPVPTD